MKKKKLTSILLSASIVVTSLPSPVLAEEIIQPQSVLETEEEGYPGESVMEEDGSPEESVMEEEESPEESVIEEEGSPEESVTEAEESPEEFVIGVEESPEESVTEEEGSPEESVMEEEGSPEESVTEAEEFPEESVTEAEESPEESVIEVDESPEESVTEAEESPEEFATEMEGSSEESVIETDSIIDGSDTEPEEPDTDTADGMALMDMEDANVPVALAGTEGTVYDQTEVVSYMGENGTEDRKQAEVVTSWTGDVAKNTTVKWVSGSSSGRYYVITGDVTIDGLIEVTGTAHLILADGATLNAKRGIKVSTGNTLYICAQSEGTGKLIAEAAYGSAIGGTQYGSSSGTDINQPGAGNIYICGGNVTATTTAEGAAAIGGASGGSGGKVTICGGKVTATSTNGDGIGGGAAFTTDYNGRKGSATIDASSITGGGDPSLWNGTIVINKTITIYGGTLTQDTTVPKGYTLSVPDGDTLTIGQGVTLTLDGTLKDDASIINNGTFTNNSTFTANGAFTNSGTFQNNGDAVFNGKVSNTEEAEIIINRASTYVGSTLTVGKNAEFDNQGKIELTIGLSAMENNGTFTNSGSVSGDGPMVNNGTVTNHGTWGNSKVTNSANATFTNNAGHTVSIRVFDNQGKVVNHGSFEGKTTYEAKITNSGDLQNNSSINVRDIENTGTITNAQGAACTVNDILTNRGTFTNNGEVTVGSMAYNAGSLLNYSTWNVNHNMYNGKTYWNGGETYANALIQNEGTITVASDFSNYAGIQNKKSITVSGKFIMGDEGTLSGEPIRMINQKVSYTQADGSTKSETLEYEWQSGNILKSGKYIVDGTLPSLTIDGDVTLILTGDSTVTGSITVKEGAALKIYTASDSTYTLKAANIDGNGEVIVNSGNMAVSGKVSQITLNNGKVTAESITNGTVNKGTVNATIIDQITVNAGEVAAESITNGTVNKGTVNATIIDQIIVNAGEVTADSIGTVKISSGIVNASAIDKAIGVSENSGVIFADAISDTDNFKGIAFIGDTGRIYGVTSLTLSTDFTVPEGKTFIVENGKSLFIPKGIVLTYAGIIKIKEAGILYTADDSCLKKEDNGEIIGSSTENIEESLITYVRADGTNGEKVAKSITEETTQLTTPEGDSEVWYVVLKDVSLSGQLNIQGNVNLILADGFNLDVLKGGICVPAGSSLTIYGQNAGTGKLTAKGNSDSAGIGGSNGSYGVITVNGGTIEATGGSRGAGIGGGNNNTTEASSVKSGKMIINGGNVTATGGYRAAGIGGGIYGRGEVEVNGGKVMATGGQYGAGIGGGYWSCYYSDAGYDGKSVIHINGGEVTAKAGDSGAGIGSGERGSAEITIAGGKVNAEDSGINGYGSAIGAGNKPNGNHSIKITGGEVIVNASRSIGIGSILDRWSSPSDASTIVSIEGGTVKISCEHTTCIYSGGQNGSVTISGGKVTATSSGGNGINSKNIVIFGGVVDTETKDDYGSGIGATDSNVTISGGIVRAANLAETQTESDDCNNAIKAKQLTLNGNAVIYTSNNFSSRPLILAESKEFSSGILFEGANGSVYGNPLPGSSWEVPADSTLTIESGQTVTIPAGVTLVNKGRIVIKSGGHLTVKGTLDTENGVIINEGMIQPTGGTIKGEENITNSGNGSIVKMHPLVVTIGSNGKTIYGNPYEVNYQLEDGTDAPVAAAGTYEEQYTAEDGTVLSDKPASAGRYAVTVSYQTEEGIPYQGSVQFTIVPKTIGIEWGKTSFVYDGTAKTPTATATDLVGADTCEITVDGARTDAGTDYIATAVKLSNSNYALPADTSLLNTTFAITKADAAFISQPKDAVLTYNGSEQMLVTEGTTQDGTVQYRLGENGEWTTTVPTAINAGEYQVYYQITGDRNHNDTDIQSVDITIAKKDITVSGITADNKVYDGTTTATLKFAQAALEGLVEGDTLTVMATGTFDSRDAGENKKVTISELTLSAGNHTTKDDTGNYQLAKEGQQTETRAAIAVKAITAVITPNGGTYGTAIIPATAVLQDYIDGENPEVTLTYKGTANDGTEVNGTEAPEKAGSYTVTATISDRNYELTGTTEAAFTVERASAELSVSEVEDKSYRDADFKLEVSRKGDGILTYLSNKENVLRVAADGTVSVKDAGTATITVSLKESANYLADTREVTITVKKIHHALNVEKLAYDVTYGDVAFTIEATPGDSESNVTYESLYPDIATVNENGTVSIQNAGTATIKVSMAESRNYLATTKEVTVNVAAKPVTVTPDDSSKTYGNEEPQLTYKVKGLVGEDKLSDITVSREAGEHAGTYKISANPKDGANPNYQITCNTGTFTIDPKTVGITWGKTSFVYDGSAKVPAATATGLVGEDTCEVTVTGAMTDAGADHTAKVTKLSNSNYALPAEQSLLNTTFTIAKKEITVAITPNGGAFDAVIPATAELQGCADGESPEVTLTYTGTANDGTEVNGTEVPTKAGSYTVTATISDSNYELAGNTEAAFMVERASAELSVSAVGDKNYRDADFKLEVSRKGDGVLTYAGSNEKVLSVSEDGTVSVKGAGTATITVSLKESANYLADKKEITVTVKKINRVLTVEKLAYNVIYGDAAFTIGAASGDRESAVTYASSDPDVAAVSENGTVSIRNVGKATIKVSVAESSNYNAVAKEVTVNVAAKPTTVTPVNASKTYGKSDPQLTYTVKGLIGEDTLSDILLSRKAGEDAGDYTISAGQKKGANKNYQITFQTGIFTISRASAGLSVGAVGTKNTKAADFKLKVSRKGNGTLTYKSNNKKVLSVTKDGTVSVKGAGTATVTVSLKKSKNYLADTRKVTITVKPVPAAATSGDTTPLLLCSAKQTQKTITLTWNRIKGADGYILYGNRCNTSKKTYEMKKLVTITNGDTTAWTQKNLKKGTSYKYRIKAYRLVNGKKKILKTSLTIHAVTTGGRYGTAKGVTIQKVGGKTGTDTITLKKGKTARITARELTGKKPSSHRAVIRYVSGNAKVATVSASGKITAKKKGTCRIWICAQNGSYKTITVKVK